MVRRPGPGRRSHLRRPGEPVATGAAAPGGRAGPRLGLPRGPGHELSADGLPSRAWITEPAARPCARRWPPTSPSLAAMLVRAFADDPVANFMFAGDRRRRRRACMPSSPRSSGTSTCPTGTSTPPRRGRGRPVGPARRRPQRAQGAGRTAPGRTLPGQRPQPPGPPPALRGRRAPPQGAALVPGHPGHRAGPAGAGRGLGPPAIDDRPRSTSPAARPTSSRPRSATSRSTPGSASRWSRSSTPRWAARPSGACGASRGSPERS